MVRRWFISTFLEKEINKDYRKYIAAKTLIWFSLIIILLSSIYSYLCRNTEIFYFDSFMFFLVLFIYLIFRNINIFLMANIFLFVIIIGELVFIYINKAQNNVALWSVVLLFYLMVLLGHKKGLIYSGIFFIFIFTMIFNWIGDTITQEGYIRFMIVFFVLILIFFSYEYSTFKTVVKLEEVRDKLDKMTKIDDLTTLYNRRYFNEVFPKEIKIARRNNTLLVFAMIDIDYFKNFNDTYGHLAGDKVLQTVAQLFKDSLQRPDDYIFRLGGEEFGILFKTNSKENGIEVMKKVCENVEALKIAAGDNTGTLYVTVSIGLYIAKPNEKCEYDDIYKASDNALYEAKMKGRNTIQLA